jgi:hypothetical protein
MAKDVSGIFALNLLSFFNQIPRRWSTTVGAVLPGAANEALFLLFHAKE